MGLAALLIGFVFGVVIYGFFVCYLLMLFFVKKGVESDSLLPFHADFCSSGLREHSSVTFPCRFLL
ncbi:MULTISPECIES: hypothetical protein [Bacillaceae]|uniref:Uncharacterized protein n=1 Tax=Niallia hominis TaxID=3133173 RepID=A0ABV1EWH4_9BACI|nr:MULTISPECIES: hypothetical protein [Bacillaceae]MCF2650004.1 hypothetical protein [Niallia circulans]CAI9386579.1 hypothetical protein BACSP_01676 [Bacillus sp. T2.9-1]